MIFETDVDRAREERAIKVFCNTFGGSYEKLSELDIDFKIYDKDRTPIAYVEVKGRIRMMHDAYPLPISVKKLVKLMDKRLNPIVVWACEDGIIYGKVEKLVGDIKFGGRLAREGEHNDTELMAYFGKQKNLRYVRF